VSLAGLYLADGQEVLAAGLYREVCMASTRALWAWLRLAVYQAKRQLNAVPGVPRFAYPF
jgi:hypothetical protein